MDNDALYETDDNKKKFQITRGMLILAAVILVVIIIVIIMLYITSTISISAKLPISMFIVKNI